jgi:hypothetical protein
VLADLMRTDRHLHRYDDDQVSNPSAPKGKTRKYAQPERERRFLLERRPDGDIVQTAEIKDRYLSDTRLRVRKTIEHTASDTRTVYKLTQKIPAPSGGPGLITTLYLEPREYAAMCVIPHDVLHKTRLSIPPYGVDIFHPPLDGLVLAEIEFDSDEEMREFVPKLSILGEVTHDVRFTGGRLTTATREELAVDLLPFGIQLLRP